MDFRTPKIIILVLNWNGWRDTLDCLESLYRNDYPDYQVVLLDNNSQDDSLDRVREWADGRIITERGSGAALFTTCPLPHIMYDRITAELGGLPHEEQRMHTDLPNSIPHPLTIIRTGANLGFAGGNNVGLRYARHQGADYVLLLNNDARLRSADAVTAMVRFMETHPQAGACGGRLFYPDGSPQTSYGNFPSLPRALAYLFPAYKLLPAVLFRTVKRANVVPDESIREPLAVDYPSGACLIARSEAIDDVGLLDERYFMYAEETDWCLRMKEMEWERYYVPQAEIVHRCAGSPGSSSDRVNLVFLESLFAYYRKNFTPRQLWAVSAGYILRSFCSWIYWLVATALRPESGSSHTRARMIYWRRSLELAAAALADLFRGEIGKKQVQAPARSSS